MFKLNVLHDDATHLDVETKLLISMHRLHETWNVLKIKFNAKPSYYSLAYYTQVTRQEKIKTPFYNLVYEQRKDRKLLIAKTWNHWLADYLSQLQTWHDATLGVDNDPVVAP